MPKTILRFEQCCWDVRAALGRLGPDEVCCDELTPRQCRVLRALDVDPECNLSALAEREGLTPSGMSRRVDPLVDSGHLVRERAAGEDGRAIRLALTPRGAAALRSVQNTIYEGIQGLWDELPAAKRVSVLASLELLVEAARRAEAKSAARARRRKKKGEAS